jgi:SAM-dependent methyltransferase
MNNRWQQIWQNRHVVLPTTSILPCLMAEDGFDTFNGIQESAWMIYHDQISSRLQIQPHDSIFETGCGAGAFLYPWYLRQMNVGGIDYSGNLIEIARRIMPRADLQIHEAIHLNPEEPYDIVVANSVFFYFQGLDYAASVLTRMLQKARRAVAILDVADLARKEECIAQRRKALGPVEYEKKYAGLDHLYYDRNWFSDAVRGLNVKVHVEDQNIPGYAHNPFRFNVFITKIVRPG